MIIFLYGENSYGINRKIQEIVSGYKAKNPSEFNLAKFDAAENDIKDIFESIKSNSLIPEKRLIIIKNIFSGDCEAILQFFKSRKLSEDQNIILAAVFLGSSAKNKLFEYLIRKPNQSQNFRPLKEYEAKEWIKKFADSINVVLTGEAIDFLVSHCGADPWRLDSEIRKLADFSGGKIISAPQVEDLISAGASYEIFALTDALAKKDKTKALKALYQALDNGEKPTELLGLLAWQVRNVLKFKLNPDKPAELKLHPFVLGKVRESAKLFSIEEIGAILSKIIDLDLKFKLSAADEKTALSLLIAEL